MMDRREALAPLHGVLRSMAALAAALISAGSYPTVAAAQEATAESTRPPAPAEPPSGEVLTDSMEWTPRTIAHPSGRRAFTVGAGALLAIGAVPEPGLALTLAGGLRKASASTAVELRVDLPATRVAGRGRVTAWRAAASFLPCWHGLRLGGCGMLSGGVLMASGEGYAANSERAGPFLALGARGFWDAPLSPRLFARVYAEAQGSVVRTELLVSGTRAWSAPPVSAGGGLAFIAVLP